MQAALRFVIGIRSGLLNAIAHGYIKNSRGGHSLEPRGSLQVLLEGIPV